MLGCPNFERAGRARRRHADRALEEGRAFVQGIKDDYAEAAAAHPEFESRTVTFTRS
jgi:hypothetical protein